MVVRKPRDFTPPARKKSEPLVFTLYGEKFEAHSELQGSIVLSFAAAMSSGDDDNGASAALILNFFDEALKPDSLVRFKKLIHDPETIVPAETLAELVSFLMESFTSRDLEESSEQSENS